jgi:outer membrane biosynthesis protein TonB
MKTKFLVIASGILALAYACNNGSESKSTATDSTSTVATDTAANVATDTAATAVEAPPAIDSAAVTREYLAAKKKTKKTTPPKPKKQGDNEVEIYVAEPIPSHEALEQPVPAKNMPREVQVIHTKEYVYFSPSENASFPGGEHLFAQYLQKSIVYPEAALSHHVEGTVYADVYIDSLGHVSNVEFPATHLGSGLEEEASRVLMQSPRWNPAKENGQPVNSKITLPVIFKIDH